MLGAIIVRESYDKTLPQVRDQILARFPEKKKRHLHWVNFNHEQRVVVMDDIAKLRLGVCLALSHKVTIPGTRYATTFSQPQYLYNYLVRFLLERLIPAAQKAAPGNARLKLVFSKKGGTNYQTMAEYLHKLASGADIVKAPRHTNWGILDIDGIRVENHTKMAGLQLADCTTSAFFNALEPNRFDNYEPSYARKLIGKLVNPDGLTVVPNLKAARPDDKQLAFLKECWGG